MPTNIIGMLAQRDSWLYVMFQPMYRKFNCPKLPTLSFRKKKKKKKKKKRKKKSSTYDEEEER